LRVDSVVMWSLHSPQTRGKQWFVDPLPAKLAGKYVIVIGNV